MNRRELAQQKKQVERDRYIAEQARKMKDIKPLPTPDKLELSHIFKWIKEQKRSSKQGYWTLYIPDEFLTPIDRELRSVKNEAKAELDTWEKQPGYGSDQYWDCLQELMVKEWKRRQSKLYRALK